MLNSSVLACSNSDFDAYAKSTNTVLSSSSTSTSIPTNISSSPSSVTVKSSSVGIDLLHARLGHLSLSKMKYVNGCTCDHLLHYFCEFVS